MERRLRRLTVGLTLISAISAAFSGGLLTASLAQAADVPIPVRVYINKPGSKTKFVSKGTFALPDPNTDNPANEGGRNPPGSI